MRIIPFIIILWLIFTGLLGYLLHNPNLYAIPGFSFFSAISHPNWALFSLIPMAILKKYHLKTLQNEQIIKKDELLRGYFVIFLMAASFLTGLSTQMRFLPHFWHQFTVWPLIIFGLWDQITTLKLIKESRS